MQYTGYEKFRFLIIVIFLVIFFSIEKLICWRKTMCILLQLLVIYNSIQRTTPKAF